jgi:hypothetical protein
MRQDIRDLEAALPEVPKAPQAWTADVTPENLAVIMSDNNEAMALLSDEAGIFENIGGGRYSKGVPNLDVFLQGHAGSPIRVNRGSRSPILMQNPALTLGFTPQPEVVRGLTDNPGFRGRGLLARFIYTVPPCSLGFRTRKLLRDSRAMVRELY